MGNRTGTLSRRYRVKDEDEIKVSNTVGAGQPGGWAMSLDGKFIAQSDGEGSVSIGKGEDLLYLELRIEFVIQDRRWEHDRLIATTVVSGAEDKLEIVHEQKGDPGDSATYTTLVQFV